MIKNETSITIFKAVYAGRIDLLEQAIEAGESVNGAMDHQCCSPLAAAILRENMPMAIALIDAGAKLDRQDGGESEVSPLEAAASRQSRPMLAMLIERGLNLSEPDGLGPSSQYNPLKTCLNFHFFDGLEMLLSAGENFQSWSWKEDALVSAALRWRAESQGGAMWDACVELLIKSGADVEHALEESRNRNPEGFDALRRAKGAWNAKLEAEALDKAASGALASGQKAARL